MPLFFCAFFLFGASLSLPAQTRRDAASLYNAGRERLLEEDYYGALESFLEASRLFPAYAENAAALAECYYYMGELDEAVKWVREARRLARGNTALLNLEASILIARGNLLEAETALKAALKAEPNNREALFVQCELDIARGLQGEALGRYREALRRYPADRRLLLSLALTSLSMGDERGAENYVERALVNFPDDYRVLYLASYIAARRGALKDAALYAERALYHKADYAPSLALLSNLRYREGGYEEAARLADERLEKNATASYARYLRGLSYWHIADSDGSAAKPALDALERALTLAPTDEFTRAVLEEALLAATPMEDARRTRYASYHFREAAEYKTRGYSDEALFEYRRGLRLNPYARERRDYAELLRTKGLYESYLAQLEFIKTLNTDGAKEIDDIIEGYKARNSSSLTVKYGVGAEEFTRRWKIGVFTTAEAAHDLLYHADGALVAASYLKDVFSHERNIDAGGGGTMFSLRKDSFANAFRAAREAGNDYFVIVSLDENERDLSVKASLYAARTGTAIKTFSVYRSGSGRLRNAVRYLSREIAAALPFSAVLVRQGGGNALINKGKIDGVTLDADYEIVKAGATEAAVNGIGLVYGKDAVVGTFKAAVLGEEVAEGRLKSAGFFDAINLGDEVLLRPAQGAAGASSSGQQDSSVKMSPEMTALLRTLK